MQLSEAVTAGSEVVRASSQYGPETFLAVIIVGAVLVIVGLWVWKVLIPVSLSKAEADRESARSSRENAAQLSQAMSSCLPIISGTHERVFKTGVVVDGTEVSIHRMGLVLKVGITAIEKLAKDSGVDISQELSRIHGILDDTK